MIDRGAVGGLIDGRSREGRFLRDYERALREYVGGKPNIIQQFWIQRAARVALHLELIDEQSLAGGRAFNGHDHRYYIAWSNSLVRTLARLGVAPTDAPTDPVETLERHLARRGAA